MKIRFEPRQSESKTVVFLSPLVAVLFTGLFSMLIFAILGVDPITAVYTFFIGPVTSIAGWAELFVKATTLVLIGIGLSFGFRSNIWNIGAEGQLTIGALTGGGLALLFYNVDSVFLLPAMIIAGIFGGAIWAAIPAFLRVRFNTNEILTSLMLVYVAQLILSYLIQGPMRAPDGYNFPESRLFHDAAVLPTLISETRLHAGWNAALFFAVIAWILWSRHIIGFQVKVAGDAPLAARFSGVREKNVTWLVLLISGGTAGLAGMIEVSGPIGQIVPIISPGYGFTAIIVAFLGRLNPIGIIFSGMLMALTYLGGDAAQIEMKLPNAVTGVFQGMLLFFLLATDFFVKYRIRFGALRETQDNGSSKKVVVG